ncbi:MAG: PAS domain-containing protein, partial [Halobacteriales archaeon]|nr:PAS domain-containing protein [Halobacteriales archaeon]
MTEPAAASPLILPSIASVGMAHAGLLAARQDGMPLRDLLENAAPGIHQADAQGRILWANRAELEMLGYAAQEYVGRNFAEFHADPGAAADILERLARGETLRDHPARLLRKDGTVRHVRIHCNARFEDGRLVHTRSFTRDATERVQIDAARDMASRLVETMRDGFLQLDSSWRITYANPSVRGGRSPADFEGHLLWDLFPDVAGTEFEARYRHAMESRERVTFESYYAPMKTWMENTVLPVEGGLWLHYRDVGERRRTEELLEARNRQQKALTRLGHEALSDKSVAQLLELAARQVSATLGVEFCKILELDAGGTWFDLRAGVGWKEGLVGTARVPADGHSQAGYALQAAQAVVVSDLEHDGRFSNPLLLQEHGVVSGMTAIIGGHGRPFGVVGAHSAQPREFTPDDVEFLQAVAHTLAAAIERRRIEAELRKHRDHLEELVAERTRRLAESNSELEAFNY